MTTILAIDTALESCSAAVTEGERVLAARSEPMARGHQERLATLVRDLLAEAGVASRDLDRIAVTVGPGSFTGVRVGLAFAKGLGLALKRPVVGVGTLEAMAATVGTQARVVAAIDARREQIYLQGFHDGRASFAPAALGLHEAEALIAANGGARLLVGSGARLLKPLFPDAAVDPREAADPVAVARLALAAPVPAAPPEPLYLRAPDAKLPA